VVAISQAVVDPVVSKIDALLAAMEQRMPTATTLGAEIAAPLVAAVVAAVPPPPKLDYRKMSFDETRDELKKVVTPAMIRSVEAPVQYAMMIKNAADPLCKGDVYTPFTPPQGQGSNTNAHVHLRADRATYSSMKTLKAQIDVGGSKPEVFRDWNNIRSKDTSHRHVLLKSQVKAVRHDYRSGFRRVIYMLFIYPLFHADRADVSIHMLFPNAAEPGAAEAEGSEYFAYERSVVCCASGSVNESDVMQRRCVVKKRRCLVEDQKTVLAEAVPDNSFEWGAANLKAAAVTARIMIMDTAFDWHAGGPVDHVGDVVDGPRAWRLLMPKATSREGMDKEVETMTPADMDAYEAGRDADREGEDVGDGGPLVDPPVDDDDYDFGLGA